MTIREYISQKLVAFELSEAQLCDVALNHIDPEEEYTTDTAEATGKALISIIEELILMPRLKSISEGGFSMSWDYDSLSKYYMWLCRKWKVKPNDDVLDLLGVTSITDKTDIW